ncbi:MAG TPA: chemotaxis protein CheB [Solirubrobacteraceae bacterium]|jgi:two-component system chemotaxis response regulator CheB
MPEPAPGAHDLVVIGASAGGVETLRRLVSGLPSDLDAAVCIVVHIAPTSPSALAYILERAGPLQCAQATGGEVLRAGRILVAPPDRHLVIEDGHARLTVGPRENGHRPAVDALFRSAAAARGAGVVGVILTGNRDDGTAGLAAIKAAGGAAIVQDPGEALYSGMPTSAIANVAVDAVVSSPQIADAIADMVKGGDPPPPKPTDPEKWVDEQDASISCPECGGVLEAEREAGVEQWRCQVGHRYSQESLAESQAASVEAALWTAIRALRERGDLLERLAGQCQARGQLRSARSFRSKAEDARSHADQVRRALTGAATTSLGSLSEGEDDEELAESATG